jgi:hypothetical protein
MEMDGGGIEDEDEEVDREEGIDGASDFFGDVTSVSWDSVGEWDGDCWTSLMVVMVCL